MLSKPRQPMGMRFSPDGTRGYHIDLAMKAAAPEWDRTWSPQQIHWVGFAQWGLGCFERHVAGDGPQWRAAAIRAGDFLVEHQVREGALTGAWPFGHPFPHTFDLRPPWVMSMAQGEIASLLVRLAAETGDERYADAARLALVPLDLDVADGGVRAFLPTGGVLYQEYPTTPPAHVLNGAIFTLFGAWDVWRGLGDENAARHWNAGIGGLLGGLHLWDLGYWSRYDLFPHATANVASPFYHDLHIQQLAALERLHDDARLGGMRARFISYADHLPHRARGLGQKMAFRVRTPRKGLHKKKVTRLATRLGLRRP